MLDEKQTFTQRNNFVAQRVGANHRKASRLENAFHAQTRTIADLTGENLELIEEMKNMRAAVDNQEALNDK